MTELEPCPFCGSTPEIRETVSGWAVECGDKDCMLFINAGRYETLEEAIDAWNNRQERTCTNFGQEEGTNGEGFDFACSSCGYKNSEEDDWKYCPGCGAKVVEE